MGGAKTLSIIVAANIKGLETSMKKANGSVGSLASNAARLGSMLTFGVTAPLVAMGKQAANTFVEFENNMQKVLAVTGSTKFQFQELTAQAKKLGAETQFTARQFAELQLILGRKGFDPRAIQNMTQSIADLALATGSDLSLAAEVVSSSINAFNLESTEASRVANTLASAAANSSIQLNTFATAFGHAGTAANAVGVDIEELSAMMGVLMDNGIKASKAGTGLRKAFMQLNEEGVPFGQTLDQLAKGTMSLNEAQELVGITAANQLLILSQNRDKISELTHEYTTNTNRLDEMSKMMGETAFAKIKKMQSAIESMNIELGELIINKLEPVIKLITKLATKFSELDPEIKDTIVNLGAIAASIGPLLLVIGALIGVLLPVIRLLGGLARVLLSVGRAAIAGAKWLGVGGITGVAAIFGVEIAKSSDSVEELNNQLDNLQGKDFMFSSFEEFKRLEAQSQAHKKLFEAEKERVRLFKKEKANLGSGIILGKVSFEGIETKAQEIIRNISNNAKKVTKEFGSSLMNFGLTMAQGFSQGFAELFLRVTDSEGAIVSFGEKFNNFAKQFLAQIGVMILQAGIFAALLSVIFPGAALGGGLGAAGFQATFLDILGGGSGMRLQGFANGGRPPLNKMSLVGENGPELFNPGNQSGRIIPNDMIGGSVIPDVRISGNDLLIVFNKAQRRKNLR